jgi:hypothetical protein
LIKAAVWCLLTIALCVLAQSEYESRGGLEGLVLPLAGAAYCALQVYNKWDAPRLEAYVSIKDEAWERFYVRMDQLDDNGVAVEPEGGQKSG